ncbi:hypothetical protein QYE76_059777 [Lolium multiflorum]|uniref:Uncharacterized protein n=1 Tax=Lolium multiflorum TaxID=4521 RepID=A0AAD8W5T9_LOLMU|nr:hypothetical protein QYE76_059777 [Lolium multiflorum]
MQAAFKKLQAEVKDSPQMKELLDRDAALQVEKETLSIQHQADLQKEKDETAWLEEELAEMKRQHILELQRVADASKTELESTRKELDEVHSWEVSEVQDRLQKELQAERDLRELEKKRNDALDEVKLSWAGIVEKLDRQVEATSPHTQDGVVAAVMESRKDEWSPRADYWNTEDHLTTLSSRVSLMEKLGQNLSGAAIRTFQSLCPGEPILLCVCFWYEEPDLNVLETLRSGAPTLTDPELKEQCQLRAYNIAQYATVSKFISAPPDVDDAESDDEESGMQGSQSSDSEEAADEDILAEEPPSETPKPAEPTPEDLASKRDIPESFTSGKPDGSVV